MQKENKENKEEIPNVERGDWDAEKLAEEATNKESDEIVRQMLRGDATKGDADERDNAGSPDSKNTDYGREQTKKTKKNN